KERLMDNVLLEKAFEMPANERVTFAELILASIDYEEEKIRQSWIAEVNNRIKAVNEGKSKLLDFGSIYNED
ncbi:MAG: addiction module protein, partial [bacterium]|nr:addiction module protein [bacterium]